MTLRARRCGDVCPETPVAFASASPLPPLDESPSCRADAQGDASFASPRDMPLDKKELDGDSVPSHRRASKQLDVRNLWLKPYHYRSTYPPCCHFFARPAHSWRAEACFYRPPALPSRARPQLLAGLFRDKQEGGHAT